MNLFADLRNIIILVLMVVSGIAGYYIGSHKGRDAIEALEKIKSATAQEQQAHDAAQNELKNRISELEKNYQEEKQKLVEAHEKQNAEWDEIKADKDKRIAELSGAISSNQNVIQHLIQVEATKQVGSKERSRLDSQIAKLEKEESDEKTAISGEKCVDTVVPFEIVKMLKEVK
jgi:uncharacterized protein YgiM (DUF1202 family)